MSVYFLLGLMPPKGGAKFVKVCGRRECNPLSSLGDRGTGMELLKSLILDLMHFERSWWLNDICSQLLDVLQRLFDGNIDERITHPQGTEMMPKLLLPIGKFTAACFNVDDDNIMNNRFIVLKHVLCVYFLLVFMYSFDDTHDIHTHTCVYMQAHAYTHVSSQMMRIAFVQHFFFCQLLQPFSSQPSCQMLQLPKQKLKVSDHTPNHCSIIIEKTKKLLVSIPQEEC